MESRSGQLRVTLDWTATFETESGAYRVDDENALELLFGNVSARTGRYAYDDSASISGTYDDDLCIVRDVRLLVLKRPSVEHRITVSPEP